MAAPKAMTGLDAIDHIAIAVKDIGAAVQWYQGKFKCNVDYQDDTWAYLRFDNIRLALVVPGQHPAHLAFVVSDAESHGKLKTHRDGTRSIYVRDPSGNAVELVDSNSLTQKANDIQ